ncbi:TOX high mobility group box family member 2 isoform X3 [Rhinolophus sinicus]|uniref:TOX high mobility group box family member 2 isoform X3 n=1 Tax=Rhinolophus sinicus TaxID=89399 RepID=UPI003D78D33E
MEARVPGSQDRRRATSTPHAEPSLGPLGAPARSASFPSPSRELSNLVRSQTVRASAGRCVGPGRLEPSAAFRHSEPGLNGARGFPPGPGAYARARWRCLFDGESAYVGMSDGNPELLSTSQIQEMVHSEVAAYDSGRPGPLLGRPAMLTSHMSALSQSQLISQMGIRSGITHSSPSPPGSKSATPSPSSSTQEEESEAHFKMSGEKRPSTDPGKKAKNPKKKKKKDPNEPQKPVSAYALFFRDTQATIKGQNPSATFGDVSKIVASMWDSLGEEQKQAYKRKTEAAKKEYLKALAAYRASLVSKSSPDQGETKSTQANPPAKMLPPKQPMYAMPGLASFLTPSDLQAFRSGASPASLARTLGSKSLLPGLSASPPPPPSFPLSPPLHQQLPLPPHAQGALLSPPVSMSPATQPPVLPTPMALQVQLAMSPSPPGPQDFPHISEFPSGSGSRSPGPSNPTNSGDWDSSYPSGECGITTCSLLPRDKSLYLT